MSSLAKALLFVLFAGPCEAAITRVGCAGTGAASVVTLSETPAVGDVILVVAYDETSSTTPTTPGTYTQFTPLSQGTSRANIGYRTSTGDETTSDTWTNADGVIACIYRGATQLSVSTIGNSGGAASTSMLYGTFTFSNTGGSSWAIAIGMNAAGNACADFGEAPTGVTQVRCDGIGGTGGIVWHDSNAGVTGFAGSTITLGNSTDWITAEFELTVATSGTRRSRMSSMGVGR